jgi:hypothetical protein
MGKKHFQEGNVQYSCTESTRNTIRIVHLVKRKTSVIPRLAARVTIVVTRCTILMVCLVGIPTTVYYMFNNYVNQPWI